MEKTLTLAKKEKQNGFIDHTRYDSFSDEKIVAQILKGDIDLFEVIMRRYNQKLYRIIRSYISVEDETKDVLQTTYIKAYEYLHQFKAEARFSTWLIRITINEALKHLDRQKRMNEHEVTGQNENGYYDSLIDHDNPEKKIVRSDMKQLLEQTIKHLPPKYRSVLVMREIEQMSTRETAKCLKISRANVKVRLYRAKNMLRKKLERRVLDTEIFEFKGTRCDNMIQMVMDQILLKYSNTQAEL